MMLLTGINKFDFPLYSSSDYQSKDVMAYIAAICLDRIVLVVGFILFSCAVLYVVSKRIGILKLQRTITAAIKAGMAGKPDLARKAVEEGINQGRFDGNVVPDKGLPLQQPMRDEL